MPPRAVSPRHAVLEEAIGIALREVRAGFATFCTALAARLLEPCQPPGDPRDRLRAASLLRDHATLLPLVLGALERALREELAQLAPQPRPSREADQPLALVPYEEMDQRVAFAAMARPFDAAHADALATLNARLARLLERHTLRVNPFRPEVFIAALHQAWAGFDGEEGSGTAVMALLQADCFLDLGGIYAAVDRALDGHGVLAGPVRRPWARQDIQAQAHDARREARLASQLREFFGQSGADGAPQGGLASTQTSGQPGGRGSGQTGGQTSGQASGLTGGAISGQAAALDPRLLEWLASMPPAQGANAVPLASLKRAAPRGMLSRADEGTIDLLGAVFETVSGDQAISPESRELLQLLQLPLLKAALADKEFFFQAEHPARTLLELLSRMGWERSLAGAERRDDRQFQAMRRSVDLAARDGDAATTAFAQAVRELEAALKVEEADAAAALAVPVASALKQEKTATARRAARDAVALRVGTGEVVAVVEAFLENKWTDVLTVAYSIDDDKPGAVRHATQAMDDLLWSVRPKLGAEERKALIAKLPGLLATLNRWLDVIKWQDADRLRFFAELADCHASIVRAPLDMPAERRLELSVQATQLAAERRLARAAQAPRTAGVARTAPEDELAGLARGTWFDFTEEGVSRKVKLAWISPLRSLYIFSSGTRQEAFSLPAQDLVQRLNAGTATVLQAEGVVVRALSRALAVNDADTDPAVAA
ncbi:hypothetical protein GCM10007387_33230 [Pseudoduganella albidiflava]|uniref:DUF1631 family protein n=2 Tax=Pseudoduganella albidiflava TaxID=321983 RepID=A0A411X804_9BURK|nr:DUF1631 family protein [Pseudoduganella albidiflava]GGY48406.1 hypothetical protein GCM10007387_33230 [Pseudoduganella albidiflava]